MEEFDVVLMKEGHYRVVWWYSKLLKPTGLPSYGAFLLSDLPLNLPLVAATPSPFVFAG